MAKLIACGPLSDETEEALHLNYKGGMLKDFLRTNDFAIQLQESNRQLRARIAELEAENATLVAAWKREEDSWIERNAKLEAEKERAVQVMKSHNSGGPMCSGKAPDMGEGEGKT